MASNIKLRRKLSDLYKRGVEVRFGPDGPKIGPFDNKCPSDSVAIYVAVPSPLQREQAVRDSRAKAAAVKSAAKKDALSPEGQIARSIADDMDNATLIEYLLMLSEGERDRDAERDVLGYEEWSDITELQDALRLVDEGQIEEGTDEYEALMERDRKYGEDLSKRRVELADAAREALELLPRVELERRALEQQAELISSEAFVKEYTRLMIFYSARDPEDHDVLFFESVTELANQDEQVQGTLEEALSEFLREESEAKNAPGAEDGSQPSMPPSEPETSEASTPQE